MGKHKTNSALHFGVHTLHEKQSSSMWRSCLGIGAVQRLSPRGVPAVSVVFSVVAVVVAVVDVAGGLHRVGRSLQISSSKGLNFYSKTKQKNI